MKTENSLTSQIKVVGVGDFGCKIIDYIAEKGYRNLELIGINTDVQSLLNSRAHKRITIGDQLTHGQGTLGDHDLGRRAAIESKNDIQESIRGADIIFLTAGLGGGTGTGALPHISKIAKEVGALTIGAVTLPYPFEGDSRIKLANNGVQEIENHIHTLVTIPGNKLSSKVDNVLSLDDSIAFFGDTLFKNIVGLFRLINVTSLINVDLSDIRALLSGGSTALMAFGESAEDHSEMAANNAIENALGRINISEAKNVLFNVTGSPNMSLFEVDQIATIIRTKCSPDVNLVFGAVTRPAREDLEVTILATGTKENISPSKYANEITQNLTDKVLKQDGVVDTPKLKVFLCHSSADKPIVRKLYQRLYSRKGIDPWLDEAKLLPGVRWDNEIAKAVKESEIVIVCISKDSVNKEGYVQKEIKRALDIADEKPEGTIFIIPLKLEECDVPERLGQWQWVNYFEDGAFDRLISSLKKRAESIRIEIE